MRHEVEVVKVQSGAPFRWRQHTPFERSPYGPRRVKWYPKCSCGWFSPRGDCDTKAEAVIVGKQHVQEAGVG